MRCVQVALGERSYPIYVERGLLKRCGTLLPQDVERWVILCDEQVATLYGETVERAVQESGHNCRLVTFPAGERSKSLTEYEKLCRTILAQGFTRRDGILALGGGVCGDLAGFIAATLLRGVALIHIATTLLSQVDSSIGGKTGINLPEGKNLLGAFYQPRAVWSDPDCLATLPPRELSCGVAEVIKYGMIADDGILDLLEQDEPDSDEVITRCAAIKAKLVSCDEMDQGARRILNFGHTFGHVYEAFGGFSRWNHGEAVAAGMMQMLRWEQRQGYEVRRLQERLKHLLRRYRLPDTIACPAASGREYLLRDKKCAESGVDAVLVIRPGQAEVRRIPAALLLEGWQE